VRKGKEVPPSIHVSERARGLLAALSARSGHCQVELASMAIILLDSVSRHLRLLGGHDDEEVK